VLDPAPLPEDSGIAESRLVPGRLYHANDSHNGPFFFVSDMHAGHLQKVRVEGLSNIDDEDIAVGPCKEHSSCLFIGDIGDNRTNRKTIDVWIVEEQRDYGPSVTPLRHISMVYPDHPHDAEGLGVHPNGDLYVLTKDASYARQRALPARLFKLTHEDWQRGGNESRALTPVGEIDFSVLASDADFLARLPTALDIAPDGTRFIVLTYGDAYEFGVDLAHDRLKPTQALVEGKDYVRIRLQRLEQQECIAYLGKGGSFVYTGEAPLHLAVPLMRVDCSEPKEVSP
jgi:hypothetical protein